MEWFALLMFQSVNPTALRRMEGVFSTVLAGCSSKFMANIISSWFGNVFRMEGSEQGVTPQGHPFYHQKMKPQLSQEIKMKGKFGGGGGRDEQNAHIFSQSLVFPLLI